MTCGDTNGDKHGKIISEANVGHRIRWNTSDLIVVEASGGSLA